MKHRKIPNIQEVSLRYDPLPIWIDTHTQLMIERGDRLVDVAKKVYPYFKDHIQKKTILALVAFWFAMGERAERGEYHTSWDHVEYDPSKDRRYLLKG